MPGPFSLWKMAGNIYRQFPICYFIEEKAQETWLETDKQTLAEIKKENGKYLEKKVQVTEKPDKNTGEKKNKPTEETVIEETVTEETVTEETEGAKTTSAFPHPVLDLSPERLSDYDFLLNNFYL